MRGAQVIHIINNDSLFLHMIYDIFLDAWEFIFLMSTANTINSIRKLLNNSTLRLINLSAQYCRILEFFLFLLSWQMQKLYDHYKDHLHYHYRQKCRKINFLLLRELSNWNNEVLIIICCLYHKITFNCWHELQYNKATQRVIKEIDNSQNLPITACILWYNKHTIIHINLCYIKTLLYIVNC